MTNCTNGGPLGSRYSVSQNRWMTTPAYMYIDWFRNIFIPSLPAKIPVLLSSVGLLTSPDVKDGMSQRGNFLS